MALFALVFENSDVGEAGEMITHGQLSKFVPEILHEIVISPFPLKNWMFIVQSVSSSFSFIWYSFLELTHSVLNLCF